MMLKVAWPASRFRGPGESLFDSYNYGKRQGYSVFRLETSERRLSSRRRIAALLRHRKSSERVWLGVPLGFDTALRGVYPEPVEGLRAYSAGAFTKSELP